MKPEYQFKIEKAEDKEKVLEGLMSAGYIVSCQKKFTYFEVSVYGKERVDGGGLKATEWIDTMDKPSIVTTPGVNPYGKTPHWDQTKIYCGSYPTSATLTSSITANASPAYTTSLTADENQETIVQAIQNNYGC